MKKSSEHLSKHDMEIKLRNLVLDDTIELKKIDIRQLSDGNYVVNVRWLEGAAEEELEDPNDQDPEE